MYCDSIRKIWTPPEPGDLVLVERHNKKGRLIKIISEDKAEVRLYENTLFEVDIICEYVETRILKQDEANFISKYPEIWVVKKT